MSIIHSDTTLDSLAGKEFKEVLSVAEAIFEDQGKGLRAAGPVKMQIEVTVVRDKEDQWVIAAECKTKVPAYKAKVVNASRSRGSSTGWAHSEADQPDLPFTHPVASAQAN